MIYLLEDDANIRKLVCYALSKEGFEVCGFEYPHSFFEKVSEKVPDLAILDIMLPEEDGLSVLSKLRKAPETHTLPVIMLTAKSSEFDIVTGLEVIVYSCECRHLGLLGITGTGIISLLVLNSIHIVPQNSGIHIS